MRKGRYRILAAGVLALAPAARARADVYDKLAKKLVAGIKGEQEAKAAVLPFAYADARTSPGGRIVAEALATAIAEREEAALVERNQIDHALAEVQLSYTGMISSGTALQAGRLIGAKYLVLGTLSDQGEKKVEINARLIEAESGIVRAAGKATAKKTWRDFAPIETRGPAPLSVNSVQIPTDMGDELMVQRFGDRVVLVEYMNTEGNPHLRLTDITDPERKESDTVALPFDAKNNRFRRLYPARAKMRGRRYLLWSGVWKPETGPVLHMAPLKGFWTDAVHGDQEVLFDFVDVQRRWTALVSRNGYFIGERDGSNLVAFFERLPKARLRVSIWSLDEYNTLARMPSAHVIVEGRHGHEASSGITEVGTRHFRFRYDVDTDKIVVEEL
ncbi:MAG: hypothetical protein HY553_10325 [Elusimicrobia bacterium]|nr:hypothetical protein [Elusimicrobiota bacterium]